VGRLVPLISFLLYSSVCKALIGISMYSWDKLARLHDSTVSIGYHSNVPMVLLSSHFNIQLSGRLIVMVSWHHTIGGVTIPHYF